MKRSDVYADVQASPARFQTSTEGLESGAEWARRVKAVFDQADRRLQAHHPVPGYPPFKPSVKTFTEGPVTAARQQENVTCSFRLLEVSRRKPGQSSGDVETP